MKKFILAALVLELLTVGCHIQSQRSSHATGIAPEILPFRPPIHLPVGTLPVSVAIADVNGDGNNDILVANGGSSNLSVYLGDGKDGFSQANGSPFPAGPKPSDLA